MTTSSKYKVFDDTFLKNFIASSQIATSITLGKITIWTEIYPHIGLHHGVLIYVKSSVTDVLNLKQFCLILTIFVQSRFLWFLWMSICSFPVSKVFSFCCSVVLNTGFNFIPALGNPVGKFVYTLEPDGTGTSKQNQLEPVYKWCLNDNLKHF